MEFTPRISQILKILLANGTPIGKQEIAEELGVSKRTVQREFEYLELCIRKYNLKLVNYKGKGVILEGNVEDLVKLEENLREEQYPDAADREGRRRRLLFELLRDRTPRKLFYYSQMLGVSEATKRAIWASSGGLDTALSLRVMRETTARRCAAL